jgi:ubiquinone/menaquinone biosynthesis C-methylase UbiE
VGFSYQDALAYSGIDAAHPGGIALTKKILQNERITRQSKILDAGCGTGQTSCFLAKAFSCEVYAIDDHPEMIKIATRQCKEEKNSVKISKGNIEKMPFPNQTFDYIIAESSTAFTDISKTLQEYYRVLKAGGVLLTIDMAAEQELSKAEKAEIMDFYKMKDLLTELEWIKAIDLAGFKSVEILKSNSILQELEEYTFDENDLPKQATFVNINPKINSILEAHQRLAISYGDQLGYRVFKAKK